MKPPCLNCKTRQLNCHSICDRYKEYKNSFKSGYSKAEQEYMGYLQQTINRMKKYYK